MGMRNLNERKQEEKTIMDRLGIDMPQHQVKPQQVFIIANKFNIINIPYDNDVKIIMIITITNKLNINDTYSV